ncbi:hypothetical protein [Planococcus salinarum]|uniref:hypothetical protein n=1 Tax=Planococcus salinarum TaxID=622695 RepID=UPI000E3BA842|nr:hypothetical protein [Planococcus salinarum]TAA73397.1 hypothetical protein D2909_00685 [Planococcus salinarum]
MKNFLALSSLVDMRNSLPKERNYLARNKRISTRVWHHSLTLSYLAGSDAASFAKYHIEELLFFHSLCFKEIFKYPLLPAPAKNPFPTNTKHFSLA